MGVMARAKQLRPVDDAVRTRLAAAAAKSGTGQAAIGEAAGLSQNRVGIIFRGETPPATIGEICAIAAALGMSGWQIIREAENSVAAPRSESLGGMKGGGDNEAEIIPLNRLDVDLPLATIPTVTLSAEELAAPAAAKNSPSTKRKTQQHAEDSGAD